MEGSISYFEVLFGRCGMIGYLLWGLSVLTVAIIVRLLLVVRRGSLVSEPLRKQLLTLVPARQFAQAMEMSAKDPSLLGQVMHAALREHGHDYAAMERAMEEVAEQRSVMLLRRIEWLNVLGNIGPMLGLMGTVWGMILAFFTIVEQGGIPNPSNLADAIGIALVTTLQGLGIAIPALAAYAVLRNRIDELSNQVLLIAQDLLLRSVARDDRPSGRPRPAAPVSQA